FTNRVDVVAISLEPWHRERQALFAFENLSDGLATDGRLNHCFDIAGVQAVALALHAVGNDFDARLPHRVKPTQVLHPSHPVHHVDDRVCGYFVVSNVGSDNFDAVLAFDAGEGLLDVVRYHLREIEDDARESVLKLVRQLLGEPRLGQTARPLVEWLERGEYLDVEKARHVGSVVRSTQLRNDGDDFRMALDDRPHPPHVSGRLLQGDRHRERRPDPKVSLLQLGHELAAQKRKQSDAQENGNEQRYKG